MSTPSATSNKKGAKIAKALKSAARLPIRVSGGKGSGRNAFAPMSGETPLVVLRLQILGCKDLLAKDRNGFSDPFVVASVLSTRHQTSVSKRTVNPTYAAKDATFDFPLYLSLAEKLGVAELIVWDKDLMKKDYLGEVAIPLEDWFTDRSNPSGVRPYAFDDPGNQPFSLNLVSTRANTNATGSVQIKLGFVAPPNTQDVDFDEVFSEFVKRTRPSLVSAPPTEGVGTVRSHQNGLDFVDDGGLSSDNDSDDSDDEDSSTPLSSLYTPPGQSNMTPSSSSTQSDGRLAVPQQEGLKPPLTELSLSPGTPSTPTPSSISKTPTPGTAKPSSSFIPKIIKLPRRGSSKDSSMTESPLPSPALSGLSTPTTASSKKFGKSSTSIAAAAKKKGDYSLEAANDIVGIVMLEIQSADDLPRLKNMTRTGWDMDPFVVISFGKKVFRTRVIRHSRSPVWDEKLLFHVRRYERAFKVQLTILDWDKLSSNDHIGDANFDVKDLLESAPQPDPATGLYAAEADGDHPMKEYKLPLSTGKEMPWESKHNPTITFRAKYQPYDALRQQFWRQYLKQYDTDDTLALSHLEITSMLDSLGSTLTRSTVNSFFTRFNKKPHADDLTFDEAIMCLETELMRPDSEKKRIDQEDPAGDSSVSATPVLMVADGKGQSVALDKLDFSGPPHAGGGSMEDPVPTHGKPEAPTPFETEPAEQLLAHAAMGGNNGPEPELVGVAQVPAEYQRQRQASSSSSEAEGEGEEESSSGSGSQTVVGAPGGVAKKKRRFRRAKKSKTATDAPAHTADDPFERVINVKNCPLCHRPRLNSKAEMDIVTHLAVCASQDWNKVDRIVVGNFVTASQAQRKWYTKIIGKISSGDYRLGANSANIIVQNRMTGQLEEEKMQVYVRLGIRLLYKGAKGQMEGGRARRLLKSLSIKQGIKYDDPASAQDIPTFIEFHKLNVNEILDPLDSFKNFNQFFYRKLKPEARPIESPDDPYRLVSGADCRLMAFETVNEATRLWIKGREFSVARLLGPAYRDQAEKYNGGALVIFRLAPQDYHRFHSPVAGTIGPMTYIAGEYYTVNPQAIRTALDVYGENARKIVPIDSPQFGRVMAVCIGAMMVGSIQTTVNEGDTVQRGQEFGYFAFGGSTIVVLFEKGTVQWDEDLLINGRASLETLVRVGMGIGTGRKPQPAAAAA
ncbi:hypothetical protein HGRIS_004377 [Hohenbuehelia grisea]|uniref:Phosphatidylserine decarboxylase proenzyme 2 n=1 Tax=Hohenbuehelia grisea TaxID=104357 RepID=A0ABR3JC23_9AGAR